MRQTRGQSSYSEAHKNRGRHAIRLCGFEYDSLRRLVAGHDHAGKTGVSATDRRTCDDQTAHYVDARFSIRADDDSGAVRGFFALEPSAVSTAGTDADRHSGGERVACAEHVLALPGSAASGSGAATAGGDAANEAASMASGSRGIEGSYVGHRYHRPDRLRTADGCAQ